MSNIIQIKRSTSSASPGSLANGELAFTSLVDVLYIGSPNGSVVAIGGARTPGVLTANQALVANSSSSIDEIRTANLVPTKIYANGAFGTTGQTLTSNSSGGVYWTTPDPSVAGSDTQIQFNDNGSLAGDSGLTYNKSTDTLTVANNVNALSFSVGTSVISNSTGVFTTGTVNSAVLSVGTNFIANATQVTIASGVGVSANGSVGSSGQVLASNGSSIYWTNAGGSGTVTSVDSGSGLTGGPITGSGTLSVLANSGIIANSSGLFVDGANGISVTTDGVNVLTGTDGGLLANSSGLFVTAGSGLLTNATGLHVGTGNGISVATDSISVNAGSTLVVNTSGVHVNPTLSLTDLTLSGNLVVNGTTTTVNTENLSVNDSIIELARNNTANTLDIGFYGQYSDDAGSTLRYTGIAWDASARVFELFANTTTEPSSTIDTGAVGYTRAILKSFIDTGALVSNTSAVNITANSTISVALVANTLSLTTALPGTSGGTGKATMTNNAILVGNSTNGYNELTLGTSGYVLQSNGTALVYDVLDGGTF